MRSILESIVCVIACLGLVLGLDACSGGNPTSPSSVGANVPKSAPGFEPFVVEIPDSPVPLTVYIVDSNPPKGGTMTVGQTAYVTLDLRGPLGYSAALNTEFLTTPNYDPCGQGKGGAGFYLSDNPKTTLSALYTLDSTKSRVNQLVYWIWVSEGPNATDRVGRDCPDMVHLVNLDWH